MEIRRFFVDKTDIFNDIVTITNEEVAHITKVLRYKVGYNMVVCPNDGYDYMCTITDISKDKLVARVDSKCINEGEPKRKVSLYQAILKNGKLDIVTQKVTELGITNITPIVSQNTDTTKENIDRLNKVAKEASKQCHRARLVSVNDTIGFDQMLDELANYDLVIIPYEDEKEVELHELADLMKKAENIAVIIGSEGGFTMEEVEKVKAIGGYSVSLGKRILRAETASIIAVGLIMYEAGEMSL